MNEEQPEASPAPAPNPVEAGSEQEASPERPDARPRRAPWWLVAVLLVVAVGVGFGAGAWVWAGKITYPPGYPVLTAEQYDKCSRQVIIYFDGDDPDPAMRAAVEQLRGDGRFENVRGETRQEVYENFKERFAEQPELVQLARPEGLPATAYLMVRKGTLAKQVEGALRTEFPAATVSIHSQSLCLEPPD